MLWTDAAAVATALLCVSSIVGWALWPAYGLYRDFQRVVPVEPSESPAETSLPRLAPFDWLKEYGPLWTPEGGAFWLAPTTPDQLAAWWTKFRPGQPGIKMAYNVTYEPVVIDIKVVRAPAPAPWVNAAAVPDNAYTRAMQSQSAANAYMQSLQNDYQNRLSPHHSNPYYNQIAQLYANKRR